MTFLEPLGIVLAMILIIYLAFKGYSILIIGPVCSLVVILTNGMNVFGALISQPKSYMNGTAGFIGAFFAIFLLGAILAKYIEESGAARSISLYILKITGKEKPFSVMVAIFLICSFLTYGGVSAFVVLFSILPLARPIFKEMNMSWKLITIPAMLGMVTITSTILPGTPSIQNAIPTKTLGTTLTAAPLLGILTSLVVIIYGLWLMKRALDKSIANGECYDEIELKIATTTNEEIKGPGIVASVSPLFALMAIVLVGSIAKIQDILVIGLAASVLLAALVFRSHIKSHKTTINNGAQGSITPIFYTAATIGFGAVVTTAPGFKGIADFILNIPGNPLISLSVATGLMGFITGSASGALGIVIPTFGETYLKMGINPDLIHRIACIASAAIAAPPHCGIVLTFFSLAGLNHRTSYLDAFWTIIGGNSLALVTALLLAVVLY